MAVKLSRGSHAGPIADINVTPLVDVMLVLLVVFIITAPLFVPQSMKINLPKTISLKTKEEIKNVGLLVEPNGTLIYEGQVVTDEALTKIFTQNAKNTKYQLQIQADKQVVYGRIAEVMALAQSAGVVKISFVTMAAKPD
jgi:biopolymer transport protein ExbD